ncbi:MAG: acyl-CoA dehydrogenase family protein [Rhodocyclaceae bacterium]|nr:acyl-CoA dehydrogenase family protein [Rhodocyclaceae bacterium]
MELRFTPEEAAFRDEVREFFRQAVPVSLRRKMLLEQRIDREDLLQWHRILDAKGWAAPAWDQAWGGTGWDAVKLYIFKEEMQQAPAPEPLAQNINLVGPVLIAFGSEAQKKYFLPRIRSLECWFAQGFSEPGAGSDLASLKTSAVRDGDDYVVNGQKVWTTRAHYANWMFALVRTDKAASKHRGISYLLIDMKTPGITVRPIITIDGYHTTNEVFLDNVRVPAENLVGQENKGWDYAKFLLGHERLGIAKVGLSKSRVAQAKTMARRIFVGDGPLADDARFMEKVAALEIELKALEITNMRVVDSFIKQGGTAPDPKASILKLKGAELQQRALELLMDVAGPLGLPMQTDFVLGGNEETVGPEWAATAMPNYFFGRSVSIFGGTSEVQRNVIAKRVLGL